MHSQFYDQVLTEIQSGNTRDGITLLVGMLDAVSHDQAKFDAASLSLKAHDLWALLLEDPICAQANAVPRQPDLLVDLICEQPARITASSTGRRLFDVTASLTFARAIRERAKVAEEKLVRAWQAGARICILGQENLRALRSLAGQDLSNVTLIEPDALLLNSSEATFDRSLIRINTSAEDFLSARQAPFDLICATTAADHSTPLELSDLLARGCHSLTEQGSFQIASFVPGHLGTGWRRACLGWDIECHSEANGAAPAGLSARTYRDTTDCIVWREFRLTNEDQDKGDTNNGY